MALACLGLAACTHDDGTQPTAASPGNVLRMAAVGVGPLDPSKLDPSNAAWVSAVDLLFDGLTGYDESTNAAVPSIASAWSTNDLVTWTFTINPERRFSDGAAVTAADVVASLERVATDQTSLSGAQLDIVEGVTALASKTAPHASGLVASDDHTVKITTRGPYGDLPALLSSPAYGIVEATSVQPGSLAPRGSGRYTIGSVEGGTTTLTSATMPDVQLVSYRDDAAGTAALSAGQVDWVAHPATMASDAKPVSGTRDTSFFNGAVITLGMNVHTAALADLRVRQAISQALDRTAMAAELGTDVATPWSSLVPPVAHVGGCVAACTGDAAAARSSVAAVGELPLLHLDLPDEPLTKTIGDEVVRQLTAAGITVQQRIHSDQEYATLVAANQQELFVSGAAGLVPSPDPYLSSAFSSAGTANLSQLSDPMVDWALNAARATADPAERRTAYGKVEDAVFAQAAAVPLVALKSRCETAAGVSDIGSETGRALQPTKLAFARG